ncbi:hypothetical protein BH10BDE1_BH10BDE1_08430 [soil metagenome]
MRHLKISLSSLGTISLVTLVALTACTQKNESGSVHIVMPSSVTSTIAKSDVTTMSSGGNNWNTTLNPTVGPELNCYAIFISGAGLNSSTCTTVDAGTNGTLKFGPFAGLLAQGSETTIEVASGADRVIHVVGFRATSASACSQTILPGHLESANFSEPFLIASQPVSIPAGPSSVVIQPTLNLNRKIGDCKLAGSNDDGIGNGGNPGGLSFGDKREGSLVLAGSAARTLTVGTGNYSSAVDLSYSPTSNSGIDSSKTFGASRQITNIDTATGTALTVNSAFTASEFQVGDEVLFYVSAGNSASAPDDADVGACGSSLYRGAYGMRTITGISGAVITVNSKIADVPTKIKNANLTASNAATNFCRVSVHRVPNFDQIYVAGGAIWTMAAAPYDATTGTGGIIAIRAQKIEVNGTMKFIASNMGYAGGIAQTAGWSVRGGGLYHSSVGNDSGGGAGSNGGGGGAGAGDGGDVSTNPLGGRALNYCENPLQTSLASGPNYTCATASNGEAKCWGHGVNSGNLGDGTYSDRLAPSRVAGGLKLMGISTGANHACAIEKGTGKLYCWGDNAYGQLGIGSMTPQLLPTLVDAGIAYQSVSAGNNSTCAVTTVGSMKCWGLGLNGQLGNGANTNSMVPVLISGMSTAASISVGDRHACSVTFSGTLHCWGLNSYGQLGDGTTTSRNVPTLISVSGYKSASAGYGFSCGVMTSGVLKCWGVNSTGQLGDGTTITRNSPAPVNGAITFDKVTAGNSHVCGISTDSKLRCWGFNGYGQLGDGTSTNRLEPVQSDIGTSYNVAAPGTSHTCGITTAGLIKCWGSNSIGELGDGSFAPRPTAGLARQQSTCAPLASNKTFLGGGGAGGSTTVGGNGGGVVFIFAKEISGSGALSILARGEDGLPVSGASGGGGGGVVAIVTKVLNLPTGALFEANGGAGANGSSLNSAGGGGGTMEVKYCAASSSNIAASVFSASGGAGQIGTSAGALGDVKVADAPDVCTVN